MARRRQRRGPGPKTRKDSPYWWLHLPPVTKGAKPERIPTRPRILVDAPTAAERKNLEELAWAQYNERKKARATGAQTQKHISFPAWCDWWLANVSVHHRGHEREMEIVHQLRRSFTDVADCRNLVTTAVSEWITERRKKVQPRTVNRELDVLKEILRDAVTHGYLSRNPIEGMARLKAPQPKRRLLTREEEARLLAALALDDRAIFLIGQDTMARLSDILELRTEDDHGTHLYFGWTKTGEAYEVPVSARVRKALGDIVRGQTEKSTNGYLFPRRHVAKTERDRRNAYRHALRRACEAAGVPYGRSKGGITFHWATRRTAATRLIRGGEDITTVQALGGWKRPDTLLQIYSEAHSAKVAAAVEKIGNGE